jgi:outer membrane protein assembly factor BamB
MILALAFLALQEVPELGTRKAGADWPGFLGPNRDSVSSERGVAWPPRVVWERPLGMSFGAPSLSRGRLLHFDRFGDKMRLTCMKSETGEELWRSEYATDYSDLHSDNDGPRCCPVVDGDLVFTFDPEGQLRCHRMLDGSLVWKADTTKDFGVIRNFFGVGSTPLVEGDLLIVQVGGSPPGSPGINSGETRGAGSGVVAFEKRTGKIRWKASDELASYSSPVAATIGERRWGFVFARGGLVGFEPATGKVDFHHAWRSEMIQSVNVSNPVVVGDRVFVTEAYTVGGTLLKVKPGGCEVVWADGKRRDRSMACWWSTPVHADGHLYGSNGMSGPDLRCVELATGELKWVERAPGLSSLLLADGRFVCLSEDGTLRLLKANPKRYEELGKVELKSKDGEPLLKPPARAAPVLARGLLYVRGRDRLVCLELIP